MAEFSNYMSPGRKAYLIGIGGVSMSSLAEVLLGMGLNVCGSDFNRSKNVIALEDKGIHVEIGHRAENIPADTDFVVRTAAVRDDNPEIRQAHAMNIPVFERTEAWGAISRDYGNAVCISGTHGKTTTTSMCTHILMAADKDPTVMIGGTLPLLNAGHRVGHGNVIVMEACEYYNSFLSFHPTVAVILNIEADHLDFFKDLYDVENSFRQFAERVPQDGYVVVNYDDLNTMQTVLEVDRKKITFGLDPRADVHAANIEYIGANSHFDIIYKKRRFTDVTLHVPGEHNVKNALAATAAAICLGIRPTAVKYGLAGFNGAGRRFEFKGKYNGADVYDDYAHHPGELKCLLDTVEKLNYRRTVLVFQPHTYSRTAALFPDFVKQLKRPDVVFLAEIFAAREQNTIGISSSALADEIDGARFFRTFDELEAELRRTAEPGDIILTVGAGDVYKIGEHLAAEE
ncbi:MAG: UDP-N-acetylmuramate--L-alanine ligase [Oscillospiraceae bacterium]|nr:UDP-N-acetylmuramate--L-alanine ligase [Oscillospiraceae bacterium]MBP5744434.1 UDP-N-acetylmuramate--L-alanine ligase [Oscillospiraceae bacterium]